MRFLVAVLVIAFVATAVAQTVFTACPATTCVKAGSQCNTNRETRISCRGDSYCNITNSNQTTGVCLVPQSVGQTCYSNLLGTLQCKAGTTCSNDGISDGNRTCALDEPRYNYLYPGESCGGDLQCIVNTPNPGTDGARDYCKSGHCKSVSNGDYCDQQLDSQDYDQCHYGKSYCSNAQRCEKYIKKGGACTTNDQTQYGCGKSDERTCMPTGAFGPEGTCQDFVSRKVGQFCRDIDDCEEGLFCYQGNSSSFARGVCTATRLTGTLNRPCNSSFDCTPDNYETCTCTSTSTTTQLCKLNVYPKGFYKARRAWNRCVRTKGCDGNNDFTCAMSGVCKSKYCDYIDVARKRESQGGLTNCGYEGVCNSAFALVASPILALVAFIAVFAL